MRDRGAAAGAPQGKSPEGHLTACHFPEEPTVEARAEDIVLDPALTS